MYAAHFHSLVWQTHYQVQCSVLLEVTWTGGHWPSNPAISGQWWQMGFVLGCSCATFFSSWFSEALHCTILSAGDNRADVLIPNSCCPHVQMSSDQTLMSSALVAYAAACVCVCYTDAAQRRSGVAQGCEHVTLACGANSKWSFCVCVCTQGIWLFCIAVRECTYEMYNDNWTVSLRKIQK